MNYDEPREILGPDGKGIGRWHYTRMNDGQVWPIGHCGKSQGCDGHATPEEACEHYKQYLLDQLTFQGPKVSGWPKNKCEVSECQNEALVLASMDGWHVHEVCVAHANRETIATLVKVGWSMHS